MPGYGLDGSFDRDGQLLPAVKVVRTRLHVACQQYD